jgi:hypothetical protein
MDRGGLLGVEKTRYESTAECLGSIEGVLHSYHERGHSFHISVYKYDQINHEP